MLYSLHAREATACNWLVQRDVRSDAILIDMCFLMRWKCCLRGFVFVAGSVVCIVCLLIVVGSAGVRSTVFCNALKGTFVVDHHPKCSTRYGAGSSSPRQEGDESHEVDGVGFQFM